MAVENALKAAFDWKVQKNLDQIKKTSGTDKGLMLAFDLTDQEKRDTMLDCMFENGLLALKSGNRSIRFRGMLDTPEEAVDQALETVAKSIPNN